MRHKSLLRHLFISLWVCVALSVTAHAQDVTTTEQIIVAFPGQAQRALHIMNADGSNMRLLDDSGALENNPKLSPDGELIAYISSVGENHEVFIMKVDGTNPRRVTRFNEHFAPTFAWMPDSQQLAVQYSDAHRQYFKLVDLDGTVARDIPISGKITAAYMGDALPDGETLLIEAVVRVKNGSLRTLYSVKLDGSDMHPLTPDIYTTNTTVSPDGRHIAFVQMNSNNKLSIAIMNTDGTDLHTVTIAQNPQLQVLNLGWSPDSTRLVFTGFMPTVHTDMELYTVNIDGTGLQQVTDVIFGGPPSPPVWLPAADEPAPEATAAS